MVETVAGARVMSKTNQSALLDILVTGYDDFKRRLTARLGSAELACEALQDTFLRLSSSAIPESVQKPRAYVLRAAYNLAINRLVSEKRRGISSDLDALLDIADDTPDQVRIVESRSEIEALTRALHELPRRRRDIIVAVALNDVPIPVLAKRFEVTVRTIQIELKHAILHCAQHLDRGSQATLTRKPRVINSGRRSEMNEAFTADMKIRTTKAKN
ncbi:RNA polymerase sigma factor [Tardiphaga sp.]|uniref:RNA polymerase sigma factor n=1 Tax=Tardiphaga sp. TaxID=1926292 RepID=UPI00352B23DA